MARKGSRQSTETWDDFEHDEVDTFHENREKELVQKATAGRRMEADDEFEMSDEEIMGLKGAGYSDEDEDDDDAELSDDGLGGNEAGEEEEEEGWGRKRSNYYGADDLENDDEKAEEEAEALRLQKKHLSEMKATDYYEEDDFKAWEASAKAAEEDGTEQTVHESLPTQDVTALSKEERLKLLETVYPEATPLAEELVSLLPQLVELQKEVEDEGEAQLKKVQFTALSAYMGTIDAYFALLIGNIQGANVNLKEHKVMEGILKGREVWRSVNDLAVGSGAADEQEDEEDEDEEMFDTEALIKSAKSAAKRKRGEAEDLDDSEDESEDDSKSEQAESDSEVEAGESDSDLDISVPVVAKKAEKRVGAGSKSDFGESTTISSADAADKAARKRNLRYYTSKIDQQSAKVREKLTGDSDLPYRERRFERERRLNEEARLRGQGGEDADDFSGSDTETAHQVRSGFEDDYYNMVATGTKQKKADRAEAHKSAVQAAKEGRLAELADEVGENGKRAINYQILKNRGLTPNRKKDNRNSRVKKRKKYETAQKKLSSVRRVFKQPTGAYGGEQTGIKKNIVRSTKFT